MDIFMYLYSFCIIPSGLINKCELKLQVPFRFILSSAQKGLRCIPVSGT